MVYDSQTGATLTQEQMDRPYTIDQRARIQQQQRQRYNEQGPIQQFVEVYDTQTGQTREEENDSNPAETLY